MAYPLEHDELILVARLLNNHIVGNLPPELERICDKLMDYAQNTTGTYETPALKLEPATSWRGDARMVFAITTLDVGV